ncbi:MAG: hypothetical protein JSV80_09445 [Acidobacteriota bacterium]|nr:MAG: hypothetical protein JSV80_09445 [Acidobacteriota bacterium]
MPDAADRSRRDEEAAASTPPHALTSFAWTPDIKTAVAAAFLLQLVLVIVVAVRNYWVLTPDSISYIRIAKYYLEGRTDLMIAGYWGPLISWIMAPLQLILGDPLAAARVATVISSIVFFTGCASVFRALHVSRTAFVVGISIVALTSANWVVTLTPDLLMSGLLLLAISRILSRRWASSRSTQAAAGLLGGTAYWGKAVAFPLFIENVLALGALWMLARLASPRAVVRAAFTTLLCFAVLAAPWVLTLSIKYGEPTFSTSGKIAHAAAGPSDMERYNPYRRVYHVPDPGRISAWEDPSRMDYNYWSPFESVEYAVHQWRVLWSNYRAALNELADFDLLGIGVLTVLAGFLLHRPWRENLTRERWRWGGLSVLCLIAIHTPVYSPAQRYYLPAMPFLIAAALTTVEWLVRGARSRAKEWRIAGLTLVIASFAYPIVTDLPSSLRGVSHPSVHAPELARRLDHVGLVGPLIGVDNNDGIYVAYHMEQPWYGDEQRVSAERILGSGAKLLIVPRRSPHLADLDGLTGVLRDLDHVLFESEQEAASMPLKTYEVLSP